jgi:protein-tyrosine-phosphatase
MNTPKVYNVLFLCTGNSARSIMAEAILNAQSAGRFRGHSAGSQAVGSVNAMTIDLLQRNHYKTDSLRSKNWDEFAAPGAPVMDFVFTVCDQAAAEVCPVWPGQPISAHWGVADPAAVTGTEEQRHRAFSDAFSVLSRRISLFMCLPIDKLSRLALTQELQQIGRESTAPV